MPVDDTTPGKPDCSGVDTANVFALRSAIGWIELGCPEEAHGELDKLDAVISVLPEVREVRWRILAEQEDWTGAERIGQELVKTNPERASSSLNCAYALRRAKNGSVQLASCCLKKAVNRFPGEVVIPFNLACYACQMNQLDEARDWLKLAVKRDGCKSIQSMALRDRDLEPLWMEIKNWDR